MKLKNRLILGVNVHSTSTNSVLEFVSLALRNKHKFFIVTPNPEIVVEAQKNKLLLAALNSADLAVPDGVGLKLAGDLKIIKGRQLMLDLFELADEQKLRIFLLGSDKKTIDKSLAILSKSYQDVVVWGIPGPRLNKQAQTISQDNKRLEQEALKAINLFRPDFLFVAFGAPKQEIWVKKHLEKLRVGGVMVVGGALDYFAGTAKIPPRFIAQIGLEWFWRLIHEPRRIKRIFNAVIVFPLLLLIKK